MKALKSNCALLATLTALLMAAAPARSAERWERTPHGVPDWVLSSLAVSFQSNEDALVVNYSVTLPDPCHRLLFGQPERDGRQVTVSCWLETQLGMACPQVLSTRAGQLDLGLLEPGDGELIIRADGGRTAKFPFSVPARLDEAASDGRPVISAVTVEQRDVVVTVQVPAGVRKVTLEGRSRLGAGAWVPRAVERLAGEGGTLTFRIEKSEAVEVLRVRGDAAEVLPPRFYAGQSEFNGQATEGTAANSPADSWRNLDAGAPPEAGGGGGSRAVVESDIWIVRGDRLFFFNQYRGLQVVDVANPDQPAIRGTLRIPAAGEQMYLLGDRHAILLARNGCDWSADGGSQALIVDVASGTPTVVKSLPVPGYIQESRLVGTALYVASQTYRVVTLPPARPGDPPTQQWEYGTTVTSFDLSDPTAPVVRDTLWFAGYGNVVAATDRFLFVGLQVPADWWQSEVRLIDIRSPDGQMKSAGTVKPAGRVADKFKLNLDGEVFTVISHVWRWENRNETVSVLETFSLADPAAPRKLGEIRVGKGEALFATRFDGDRAYIVTFERIDPLWIVDLRDPAHPTLHGELEIPGWSTYIQPLGDRLVTVGVGGMNNWQVEVSLFDVADPARPALLSKVPLGENYSWSEANYDEKAFTVLPDAGLILVPYQGYSEKGYASRVQLIDLEANALRARGVIEHAMQARRATLHGERILSLSGRELLTVNATDRDRPQVTSDLGLAWPVDQVFVIGDQLVEVERGTAWWPNATPALRVVSARDPDRLLSALPLPRSLPVAACERIGDYLYVAQFDSASTPIEPGKEGEPPAPLPPNLFLTVVELTALPQLAIAGTAEARVEGIGWINSLKGFAPRAGLLVLAGGSSGWWRGGWGWTSRPAGAGFLGGGAVRAAVSSSPSTSATRASRASRPSRRWPPTAIFGVSVPRSWQTACSTSATRGRSSFRTRALPRILRPISPAVAG
ncbi:MAG: beta-propeller domain-containing protein [Verrucomicrobia bacterium]|nr:beta-propeller domain-containing protein [Verrucomicrobiota bacterium]